MLGLGRKKPSDHERYLQKCELYHEIQDSLEHGGSDTRFGKIVLGVVRIFDPFDPQRLSKGDLSKPAVQAHLRMYLRGRSMNDPGVPAPSQRPFD